MIDMIGAFKFNNVESSVYNLICKSIKRPLLPAVKVRRIQLPNKSGVYDFDDNEYDLRLVTMRIMYIGNSYQELRTRARNIAAWLSVGTWSKLIINDEPDKYYLAKITEAVDLTSLWESGTADLTFDCQPFAYAVAERALITTATSTKNFVFTNPGSRIINNKSPQGAKFNIKITGSFTTLTLSLNGRTLAYPEAVTSGILEIDNVEMEVTLDGVNKFNVLTGDTDSFLSVISGSNTLNINGTGLNVSVAINYIPMWI